MYDSELVIRTGALSALKRLCVEAGVWCGLTSISTLDSDIDSSYNSNDIGLRYVLLHLSSYFALLVTIPIIVCVSLLSSRSLLSYSFSFDLSSLSLTPTSVTQVPQTLQPPGWKYLHQ